MKRKIKMNNQVLKNILNLLLLYRCSLSDFKFFVTSCKNEGKKTKRRGFEMLTNMTPEKVENDCFICIICILWI